MKRMVLLLIVAFLFVGCDDLNEIAKKAKYSYHFGDKSQKEINLYLKELINEYAYQDSPLYIPVVKNNCGKKSIINSFAEKSSDESSAWFYQVYPKEKETKKLSQKQAIGMILEHLGLEIVLEKSFEKEEIKFMPSEEYEKLLAKFEGR